MTKRQMLKHAIDAEHKRLILAYRNARGGQKSAAHKALVAYQTQALKDGR